MPSSGNKFGGFNPQALDPYAIENTLAQAVTQESPAIAYPMLQSYRLQRQNAGNIYGDELAAQHQYAQQELAATIANNRAKNVAELLGKPGGPALMASSREYGDLLGGAPPELAAGLAQMQERERQAKIFQDVNAGGYSAVQAGLEYPLSGYSAMTGLPVRQGTPLSIQTANIHAASGGGGGNEGVGYSLQTPVPGYGVLNTNYGKKGGWDINSIKRHQDSIRGRSGPPAPPPSTPGANTAPAQQQQQQQSNAGSVQQRILAGIKTLPPDAQAAAQAAIKSTGGVPRIKHGPNGATLVDSNGQDVLRLN